MKKYNYKDLDLYKAAKELVLNVYALLRKFPKKEEQYALCDQLRRAIISVPSNIAEGLGRVSTKEQIHFLEIAYGSLLEVECQIDIAHDIKYVSDPEYINVINQIDKVSTLLSGLRNKRLSVNSSASQTPSHPLILSKCNNKTHIINHQWGRCHLSNHQCRYSIG